MEVQFFKYQGTGNDFIMIDNRERSFDPGNNDLVKKLCDRRFGIGADGLILLEGHSVYDFNMVYFNSDGRTSSMCGNGGRCIVKFAQDLGVIKSETSFLAIDGEHDAHIKGHQVFLKMIDVPAIEKGQKSFFLNTGSPHYIQFVENLDQFPVYQEGHTIRYNDRFRNEGTNVNFVEPLDKETIKVRTYERGVEDETWSCGTGVTAAAIASSYSGYSSPVKVVTKGGNLTVSYEKTVDAFSNIYLAGPAIRVFSGMVEI